MLPAVLALGFCLGMRHATDPDHVIAVATIVARRRNAVAAAAIGAAWGLGHTLTIVIVGGGIILFGWVIPHRLGLSLELAVGVMLIGLGTANLRDLFPPFAHSHQPDRAPVTWLDRHAGTVPLYPLLRPLFVGVVHGLAGSAAVTLLVLATIGDPRWGLLYLLLFGVGTIVGMMIVTYAIAVPFRYAAAGPGRFARRFRVASGLASVAFGGFLAYHVGFVRGLFTGSP